ncbi:MAG TPA: PHP domain-containing protein [Acidimicrobiales bacterium]|nr:PHP domain-containing protein [Acidimicrobiales bacterium]
MIDLHTHSTFSDGSDTPSELAAKAHALGLRAISLTDHDSTNSYREMELATSEYGIELVAGVEVSLRDDEFPMNRGERTAPRSVHMLAYFLPLTPEHPLQQKLAKLRRDRDVRNLELVELLQKEGFDQLTLEYLIAMSGNLHSIGRPHFARAMFELHPEIVGERTDESWNRIFVEWLGTGGRAYIPKTSMPIEDFVDAAEGSSTVFSIAHPLVNYIDDLTSRSIEQVMPRVMASLRERGVKGIEAYYGGTNDATRQLMVKLTRDAGMIPTGGSDYHGHYKEDVALGVGRSGDLRVPDEILDELKAALPA